MNFKKEDKKMKKQIAMLMGVSCMAAMALSCAKESAEVKNPSNEKVTVTLTVSKDNPTKALTEDEDNNQIKTSFDSGDKTLDLQRSSLHQDLYDKNSKFMPILKV